MKNKKRRNNGETYIETIVSILILVITISSATLTLSASTRIINQYIMDSNFQTTSKMFNPSISDTTADHPDTVNIHVISITPSDGEAAVSIDQTVSASVSSGDYVLTKLFTESDGHAVQKSGSIHYFDFLIN